MSRLRANRGVHAAWRGLAAGVFVVALIMAPTSVRADDASSPPQLGGYVAGAAGWAVSFQPFIPALLPTGDAPVETTLSLATASVKSGGNAFSRAAIVWPGSGAANLGPLLAQAAGQPIFAAAIPPYPAAVQATADDGEITRQGGPGVSLRAFGSTTRSEGDSRAPDIDVPGIVRIGAVVSNSVAEVTDVDVTSAATVDLQGVSLLGGSITATAIHSRSLTRSTGSTSTAEGAVSVVGLTVSGIAAELTGDGLHATNVPSNVASVPATNPDVALNAALAALGVQIQLTRAVQHTTGGAADRLGNSLLITIKNPAIAGSHLDITLADTGTAAVASEPVAVDVGGLQLPAAPDITGALQPAPDTAPVSGFAATPIGGLALPPSSVATPAPSSSGSVGDAAGNLVSYRFRGVPMSLIILLLIATVFVGRWLAVALRRSLLGPISGGEE